MLNPISCGLPHDQLEYPDKLHHQLHSSHVHPTEQNALNEEIWILEFINLCFQFANWNVYKTYNSSVIQCAAVRTCLDVISDPPVLIYVKEIFFV